jgi:hypothetical protein
LDLDVQLLVDFVDVRVRSNGFSFHNFDHIENPQKSLLHALGMQIYRKAR